MHVDEFRRKSVSGAEELTKSVAVTGPVTSNGSSSAAETNTSTSSRSCTGRWSAGPSYPPKFIIVPPREGTGRRGS
jgi:hypothetical protein